MNLSSKLIYLSSAQPGGQDLPHPAHIHHPDKVRMGGAGGREVQEGGDIGIHIADSLHCTAETNTTFWSNYTPIKKKKEEEEEATRLLQSNQTELNTSLCS